MRTIKDLDDAGIDLRIWCYRCQRASTLDSVVWLAFKEKGWSIDMIEARQRFRCRVCRSSQDVLLIGAKRQAAISWNRQVERFFFANKSKRLFKPDRRQ